MWVVLFVVCYDHANPGENLFFFSPKMNLSLVPYRRNVTEQFSVDGFCSVWLLLCWNITSLHNLISHCIHENGFLLSVTNSSQDGFPGTESKDGSIFQ